MQKIVVLQEQRLFGSHVIGPKFPARFSVQSTLPLMWIGRRFCFAVLLVASTTRCALTQDNIADKTRLDPDFQNARTALLNGKYADAKRFFELAENHVGTSSSEINAGIAIAELQLGNYADARKREAVVLRLVSTNHARAEAHNIIGTAWRRQAAQNGGDAEQLRAAEESFRQAVKDDPNFAAAHFDLGEVLRLMGRESEASAAFKDFVRTAAEDPTLAQNADLQPQYKSPGLALTDNKGTAISSASLRGHVVLLDFWATWCPPCLRALPVMRELAHYFPPDQLQLISIDEDSSQDDAWLPFIARQRMDWTQAWDASAKIYSSFGFTRNEELSLPRYVLINPEGWVLRTYTGTDRLGSIAGDVVKTVRKLDRRAGK
jgi:thiol-disulfide isomerase/thioredoxin